MVNPILFFFGLWVDLEVSIRGFAAGAQMPDALAAFTLQVLELGAFHRLPRTAFLHFGPVAKREVKILIKFLRFGSAAVGPLLLQRCLNCSWGCL